MDELLGWPIHPETSPLTCPFGRIQTVTSVRMRRCPGNTAASGYATTGPKGRAGNTVKSASSGQAQRISYAAATEGFSGLLRAMGRYVEVDALHCIGPKQC